MTIQSVRSSAEYDLVHHTTWEECQSAGNQQAAGEQPNHGAPVGPHPALSGVAYGERQQDDDVHRQQVDWAERTDHLNSANQEDDPATTLIIPTQIQPVTRCGTVPFGPDN